MIVTAFGAGKGPRSKSFCTGPQRLLDLFGVPRQRFTLSVPAKVILEDAQMGTSGRQPYQFQPGARITLQIPRFGLDAGKTFVVTEMREDYEGEVVDLILWG